MAGGGGWSPGCDPYSCGNGWGTLGNTGMCGAAPAKAAVQDVVALAVGRWHACAIDKAASLYCWGYNAKAQVGNGSKANVTVPVKVDLPGAAKAVAAGNDHTCALLASGEVLCWGFNNWGQLGTGNNFDSFTPAAVPGLQGVTALSAGWDHNCAVRIDGGVSCWGRADGGQLGIGVSGGNLQVNVPTQVPESKP